MSLGKRISDRLAELGKDVKWLNKQTRIPVSSLYEIMNGRMKSSTRLPTIAAKLGLRALWLEREIGVRLVSEIEVMAANAWPFSTIERSRIEALKPADLIMVEAAIRGMLESIEARSTPTQKKA